MSTTPLWTAAEKSYIGHVLYEEGASISYQPPEGGQVAENLHPANKEAQAWIDAQTDAHPAKASKKAAKAGKAAKDAVEPEPVVPEDEDNDPIA